MKMKMSKSEMFGYLQEFDGMGLVITDYSLLAEALNQSEDLLADAAWPDIYLENKNAGEYGR